MRTQIQLLPANDDVNKAVKNELSPPIVGANVIRILPYSQHLRTVCLRFELHGCPYDGKFLSFAHLPTRPVGTPPSLLFRGAAQSPESGSANCERQH